jgi:hypothetical protein
MKAEVEIEWTTEAGFKALIRLHQFEDIALTREYKLKPWRCGYVRLPDNSDFKGWDYDRYADTVVMGSDDPLDEGIRVHGGLTYADEMEPGSWWFGFDCNHSGDDISEWTLDKVKEQCEKLALQMKHRDILN